MKLWPIAAALALIPAPALAAPYVLIVTWFNGSAAPTTARTRFSSAAACQRARAAVLADGARLREEAERRLNEGIQRGRIMAQVVPTVSAICSPA